MNEKREISRTLAPVEDKPGSLMAALSPYEIPPKTPGELHWIYSLWVSYGGHLIFFGMECLEFPAVNGGDCKTSREKRGSTASPENDPPLGLVQVPLIAIGGLTHGQRCFFGRKPIGLCTFMIQARYGDRRCLESGDQGMQRCFDTLS